MDVLETLGWTRSGPPLTRTSPTPKYFLRFLLRFFVQNSILVKGKSNFGLGTAICNVNLENYFLTIIKHIAVLSPKLEFPFLKAQKKYSMDINSFMDFQVGPEVVQIWSNLEFRVGPLLVKGGPDLVQGGPTQGFMY